MSNFRSLLETIASEISSQQFDHLKRHCECLGMMTRSQLKGIKTASYLLGWLSTKRLINPDNLQLLAYVVSQAVPNSNLIALIDDYNKERSSRNLMADPAETEYPKLEVLNYCSVAFTLNLDSNRLTWAHVDLLCQNLSIAIDIEYREMVWEGLKRSDRAQDVVLVTLMPVKAIINIRELSHETMAELDITKVEIVDFDSNRFDEILTSIRRGGNGDVALTRLESDDDDGGASPQIVHKFFREAAKCDNVVALEALHDIQLSLDIGVDFRGAVESAAKAGSGKAMSYLVSKGASLNVSVLYNAFLKEYVDLVDELRKQDVVLHPDLCSCEVLLDEVTSRRAYPVALFETLLDSLKEFGDAVDYEKSVVNSCRIGRDDFVLLLVEKGAQMKLSLPEDCYACFGRALTKFRCRMRRVFLHNRLPICGCEVDWSRVGLRLLDGGWLRGIETERNARLTKVDVSGNQLRSIPFHLLDGTFPILEELDCSRNEISTLGGDENYDVREAPQLRLKAIDVSHNKLEFLPLYLFQIESLESLNVSSNRIEDLPPRKLNVPIGDGGGDDDHVWRCPRLSHLDVSRNQIITLPKWFGDALNLRRFKASFNQLVRLPISMLKMKFLEHLNLKANCLGPARETEFRHIPKSVTSLIASENIFLSLPLAFLQITSLKHLVCSNNQIKSLPDSSFWQVPHLETLDLSGNLLETIDSFPLSLRDSLSRLDLSRNKLNAFPKAIFQLSFLATLNLQGNPKVKSYPDELATMKRLYEVELDDSHAAALAVNPNLVGAQTAKVHYSRVRTIIREKYYNVDYHSGVKMTVIGDKFSREQVLKKLREKFCTESASVVKENLKDLLVTNMVLYPDRRDSNSPSLQRQRSFSLRKGEQISPELATFKVWEIIDKESFPALQHAFFNENTIHLLLWNESDGAYGVNEVENWLEKIQVKCNTVRVLVASMGPENRSAQAIENRKRLLQFIETWKYSKICSLISVDQTSKAGRSRLSAELVRVAMELARQPDGDDYFELNCFPNRVPLDYRVIALELMKSNSKIAVVCRRKYLRWIVNLEKSEKDEDDFTQTMNFLTRIGALVHYSDTPGNLYEYYFTDLSALTEIIVSLSATATSHRPAGLLTRSGFVSKTQLQHLIGSEPHLILDNDGINACLTLLAKLHIIVPIDADYYLLPFRLPKERPGLNLSFSQFLSATDDNLPCVRRIYSTTQLPPVFWGQLIGILVQDMSRLLSGLALAGKEGEVIHPHTVYWRDGFVIFYSSGCLVVEAIVPLDDGNDSSSTTTRKLSVEPKGKRCATWGIDICVFDAFRRFAALGIVCDHVETLLDENDIKAECLVPYPPFCVGGAGGRGSDILLNEFIAKHLIPTDARNFSLEECAWVVSEEETMIIGFKHDVNLHVAHLVPDIVMSDLPDRFVLNNDLLEIDVSTYKELGRGGFGHVFEGIYDKRTVAVKVFDQVSTFGDVFHHPTPRPTSSKRRKGGKGSLRRMLSLSQYKTEATKAATRARATAIRPREKRSRQTPHKCYKRLIDFRREVMIFQRLSHPNIVVFKGILFRPYPCIIMDVAPGGNLEDFVDNSRRRLVDAADDDGDGDGDETNFQTSLHDGVLRRQLTHRIAYQIALGLEYLHENSICYLDLKPQNVLVWSDSIEAPINVKLSDYGISLTTRLHAGVKASHGTTAYQAPEQIVSVDSAGKLYDSRVDIFSYGTVLYKILTGDHPFAPNGVLPSVVEFKIRHSQHPTLPNGQSLVYLQALIKRCWKYWPNKRPSAGEIVAEMSEPSFHLCCKDLTLGGGGGVGQNDVVFSTVISNYEIFEKFIEAPVFSGGESEENVEDIIKDSPMLPRARPRIHSELVTSTQTALLSPRNPHNRSLSQGNQSGDPSRPRSIPKLMSLEESKEIAKRKQKFVKQVSTARSPPSPPPPSEVVAAAFQKEMISEFDTRKERVLGSPTPVKSEEEEEEEQQEDDFELDDNQYGSRPFAFSLLLTASESLVVSDPLFSFVVSDQKISSHSTDDSLSAMLWLRGRLWTGFRSGKMRVFECGEGVIARQVALFKSTPAAATIDFKSQPTKAGKEMKVFALLESDELATFYGSESPFGQRTQNGDVTDKKSFRDVDWEWELPPLRTRIEGSRRKSDETTTASAFLVLVRPGELWRVRGNEIAVIDTTTRANCVVATIVVDEMQRIKECAVVDESVWMCDAIARDRFVRVDVETRRTTGAWRVRDLLDDANVRALSPPPSKTLFSDENLSKRRLREVTCLCAVGDDIWIGCDGGGVVVFDVTTATIPTIVCVLWCRPVLEHVLVGARSECPYVSVTKLQHIGERVLVFRTDNRTRSASGREDAVHTIAEVYEARSAGELRKCINYYKLQ